MSVGAGDVAKSDVIDKVERGDKKKRKIKIVTFYIMSTSNNTIITATDMKGDAIAWASAGAHGFRGHGKSTAHAARVAAENLSAAVKKMGVTAAQVYMRGIGNGREAATRAIYMSGIEIFYAGAPPRLAHNGCRARKRRRV